MARGVAHPCGPALLAAMLVVVAGLGVGLGAGTVVGAGGGGAAPDADASVASGGASQESAPVLQTGSFEQAFQVEVYANGSARWTFVYRRPLTNETSRENFREYATRFNGNETDLYRDFETRARALARRGTEETNRTMNATAFRREAYVGDLGNAGIVEMSFLWTRFAVANGSRVVVGDVFQGGLYVAPEQRFVVTWGPELALVRTVPAPDSRTADSLTWTGGDDGRQFLDERPRVVLADPASLTTTAATTATTATTATATRATTATTTTAGGAGPADPGVEAGDGSALLPTVLGALVVLLGLGAVFAYRSGALDGALGSGSSSGSDGDPGGGAAAAGRTASGAAAGSESASESESAPAPAPEPAVSDEELMTDEDRVVGLLEENGGRMKQVNIVEETDWSKSKVSMLLSEMEEDGQISKLRVGRENIISLPGREPEVAGSPFDDEESAED